MLRWNLKETRLSQSTIIKRAKGFRVRDNLTRPGGIVILHFYGPDKHMLKHGVVTNNYKSNRLRFTTILISYAAKHAEGMQFYTDKTSMEPVSLEHDGRHALVPLAKEDSDRL
jgi:hypothetical protein